jgi:diguanylate cyclase (GGDEF)-like protein
MPLQHIKSPLRVQSKTVKFHILVLDIEPGLANALKMDLETILPVEVTLASTMEQAQFILQNAPNKFFLSITSALSVDSEVFEKVDLLGDLEIPVIAIVSEYEDEMRDQLIKRHVIDYVVNTNTNDTSYICNLVSRVYKNVSIKTLIVDDSKVSQFVIKRELLLQKFQVLTASNGAEALEVIEKNPDIKLVLVDHQMSLLDGISFVERVRVTHPKDQLLIIGLSTSTDPRLVVKFLKAGANDFIAKPFNYEILLCRINQNLDMLDAVEYAKHLSNIDFLSNVYNRRYFFERGNVLFKTLPKNGLLTAIMLDIDFFKKINDEYGHDVGDIVIQHFAQSLKEHFNPDLIARLGGEEFAIISLSPHYLNSFDYIDAFRRKIASQRLKIKQHTIQYSCSIGVTSILHKNLNEMLIHADRLLYKAKQNGRNRIEGTPIGDMLY